MGYVQGFNFIVGRMLSLGFTEEQTHTFWLFAQIIESYLPLDYFYSMSGILTDQKIFHRLMSLKLPKLTARLTKLGIDSSLLCVQWFLSIFAGVLSQHAITQVWDLFFLKGPIILPQVALALLFSERWAVKSCDNFNKMIQMLEKAPAVVHDPSDLLETALTKFRIEADLYEALFASTRKEVYESISERLHCEVNPDSQSFIAFKTGSIRLIDDYLSDENVPQSFNTEDLARGAEPLMLGVEDDHR